MHTRNIIWLCSPQIGPNQECFWAKRCTKAALTCVRIEPNVAVLVTEKLDNLWREKSRCVLGLYWTHNHVRAQVHKGFSLQYKAFSWGKTFGAQESCRFTNSTWNLPILWWVSIVYLHELGYSDPTPRATGPSIRALWHIRHSWIPRKRVVLCPVCKTGLSLKDKTKQGITPEHVWNEHIETGECQIKQN